MKSTTGVHFLALDHVRALAAFIVFAWHFLHGSTGYPISFEFTPPLILAPLAIVDEGHTGVALFMTLSGYLFAKLLDGKRISYRAFFWNRALRILPLLSLVILYYGIQDRLEGGSGLMYIIDLGDGLVLPTLPNGGWSLTVEFHFYLLLPFLLWLLRKSTALPFVVIALAACLRGLLFWNNHDIQWVSYWTIFGRIDQFVLGIMAFHFRSALADLHMSIASVLSLFAFIYWIFDRSGGFYGIGSSVPERSIWILLPTVEGFVYAVAIAWYDQNFRFTGRVSRFVGLLGTYSYSIYLLHFFWVFDAPHFIEDHFMRLDNFYLAFAWAAVCYLLMVPISYLSYRFVEAPFLRLRLPYIKRHLDADVIVAVPARTINSLEVSIGKTIK